MNKIPKILVVEDKESHRLLIKRILSQQNYKVILAQSGMDALLLLGSDPEIDVLLLDIMMPKYNGFEVLDMIKANPQTKNIRVIVVSAAGKQNEAEAFLAGAADYIAKPFKKADLIERIEAQLKLSRSENLVSRVL